MTQLDKKINQLKKLIQYKNYSDAELADVAKASLEREKSFKTEWVGFKSEETRKANELLRTYIEKYSITKFSDREDLKTLVENEILKQRIQKELHDQKGIPPKYAIDSLNTLQNQILNLKEKLGVFAGKDKSDFYIFWERYKNKMQLYAETHEAECTFKCPSCGKYALLLFKVDDYNTFNFNLLRGTFIYNKELMEEIEKGTLTETRVAKILGCSVDYITGCYNEIYLKDKSQDNR